VKLNPADIRRIELLHKVDDGNTNPIAPGTIASSVLLNSGAQQNFDWQTAAFMERLRAAGMSGFLGLT
jgi:hypothetical protein